MKIILFLCLFLSCVNVIAQKNAIRFIHIGAQTKPIGTLTITTEVNEQLIDSAGNGQFGSIIHTDARIYAEIRLFIKNCKYLLYHKRKLDYQFGTFEITISDKMYAYISSKVSEMFFRSLVKDLNEKHDDPEAIDALRRLIL